MPANGSTSRFRSAVMRGPKKSRRPFAFSPPTAAATPAARRLWSTARSVLEPSAVPAALGNASLRWMTVMTKFGIGQAVRRVEDQRFTTGAGQLSADFSLPRQCYGVACFRRMRMRSSSASTSTAAKAAPGVLCRAHRRRCRDRQDRRHSAVLHAGFLGRAPGFPTTRPVLLADRVRCVGDRVAFVVAETEAQARDAAELSRWITSRCPRSSISKRRRSRRRRKSGRIVRAAISA